MKKNQKTKTLLIGWDAADWNIIYPLIKKGAMPTLAKFINAGVHGKMATLDPPLSPILWTSIATGKRAYHHGITGFTEIAEDGKTVRAVRGTSRKADSFWDVFNANNIKTNVVGWWPSHPAEEMNGSMVSNFYGMCNVPFGEDWPMLTETVTPQKHENILKELRVHPGELTSAMLQPFFPDATNLKSEDDEVLRSVMKILAHTASVHNATTWLMQNTEWDCTAVYYDAIDHFGHLAMKYHPPQLPGIDDDYYKKYHFIMEAAYRFHDMMLERLLDLAGQDCNVILISDHGFESSTQRLINLPNMPAAPALEHSPYGIIATQGPLFKTGEKLYGSSLLDVFPTLLRMYNIKANSDVEGRVLDDAFIGLPIFIPSAKAKIKNLKPKNGLQNSGTENKMALQQLIDIGYLDADILEDNAATKVIAENQFYLARSFMDGGHVKKAIEIMDDLCRQHLKIERYRLFLTKLYLHLGDWGSFRKNLEIIRGGNNPEVWFLEGQYFYATQQFVKAHQVFEALKKTNAHPQLHTLIGNTFLKQGLYDQAVLHFKVSLEKDKNIAENWTGYAKALLALNKKEQAIEILMESLDYIFWNFNTHKLLGFALSDLELFEEASNALELSLKINQAQADVVKTLNEIYSQKLNRPEKVRKTDANENPQIIVSGLPRSGTSLMMQMLQAGGLAIFTDEQRKADQHNAKGYFELKELTLPSQYPRLFEQNKGVVKITFPLVCELPPNRHYKVIVMERELQNVIASQNKMKGATADLNFEMLAGFEQIKTACNTWLQTQKNIAVLTVGFEELLNHPAKEIEKIERFLDAQMNHKKMLNCIDLDSVTFKQ